MREPIASRIHQRPSPSTSNDDGPPPQGKNPFCSSPPSGPLAPMPSVKTGVSECVDGGVAGAEGAAASQGATTIAIAPASIPISCRVLPDDPVADPAETRA